MKSNKTLLLLLLLLQLVLNLILCTPLPTLHSKRSLYTNVDKPSKLVVVSFDGFRPDYVTARRTPNLYQISLEGTVATGIKSCFGTKTYPNHMSIATGQYEESHGIVHNIMHDPLYNISFIDYSTDPRWWHSGQVYPLWTANEVQNDGKERYSGAVMWPGSDVPYHGKMPQYLLPFQPKANWTRNVDFIISWLTDPIKPANCIFMYIDQPDDVSHSYGPFSTQVYEQVSKIDNVVGYFVQRLKQSGIYNETNLIFLSDHGMAEVSEDRIIELNSFIDRDSYSMYGKSPLWNISPKPGKENYVFDTLFRESKSRRFKVYRRHEVPFEYHYSSHRRILDIVVIADEGWDIIDEKRNLDEVQSKIYGNHGYNNSLESMKPLFIARGPNIQSGFTIEDEFENIDLYPMMAMMLELFPIDRWKANGSLHVTHQILKPIYRASHADNYFSLFVPVIFGSLCIIGCGCCFVLCMGFGKPKKRIELSWDVNSSDFDFGEDDTNFNGRNFKFLKRFTRVPESVLLLDDLDGESDEAKSVTQVTN